MNAECEQIQVLRDGNGNYGICIADLCDLYPEKCDLIQSTLAFATKTKFDENIVFITNHDDCALWPYHDNGKY